MINNVAARRYAKALFAIGKEKGGAELDTYGKDLAALGEVMEGAPELVRVFKNPIFSVEEKRAVLGKILDAVSASPMVRNFCALLADKGRLAVLTDIMAVFSTLLDAEKGVVRGELVTAIELGDAKQKAVKAQLEKQAGRQLELDFSVDSAILGGVMLKVGDNVMDASLRAQLNILKETIKRGE